VLVKRITSGSDSPLQLVLRNDLGLHIWVKGRSKILV